MSLPSRVSFGRLGCEHCTGHLPANANTHNAQEGMDEMKRVKNEERKGILKKITEKKQDQPLVLLSSVRRRRS
jgi:hypothetical protein